MAITKANTGALTMPTQNVRGQIARPSRLRYWSGEMSRANAHIRPPPNSAMMSATKASSGSAIISASRRGRTSTSNGSRPSVLSASISSLTFIMPISAVNALPDRPATTIAVRRMPISRRAEMARRSTVKISAPKRRS
jgi:hypothetical protein